MELNWEKEIYSEEQIVADVMRQVGEYYKDFEEDPEDGPKSEQEALDWVDECLTDTLGSIMVEYDLCEKSLVRIQNCITNYLIFVRWYKAKFGREPGS